jgi:rhodanese-related sulfurtransferase
MKHLTAKQAYDELQVNPNALLIDCRTEAEFYYVGHPTDAVNIEWNTEPDFVINPHFCDEVLRMAGRKERPIILICRFTNVRNVRDGFEGELDADHHRGTLGGWRKEGLPWRQL